MRVPSAVRPIAMRWLVKASVGKPGPWSENVVVKWPLARTSPVADLTTNVPVCVPPTWKVSSVKIRWKMSVKTRSMVAAGVGPWTFCQLRDGDLYVLDHGRLVRWWRCIGGCEARHASDDSSCQSRDREPRKCPSEHDVPPNRARRRRRRHSHLRAHTLRIDQDMAGAIHNEYTIQSTLIGRVLYANRWLTGHSDVPDQSPKHKPADRHGVMPETQHRPGRIPSPGDPCHAQTPCGPVPRYAREGWE